MTYDRRYLYLRTETARPARSQRIPEDQAAYHTHCRAIRESLAPAGAMEADFIQPIADGLRRLKHPGAMETAIFAMGGTLPGGITHEPPEIDAAFSQASVWLSKGENLALLTLYENRIQRLPRNLLFHSPESPVWWRTTAAKLLA